MAGETGGIGGAPATAGWCLDPRSPHGGGAAGEQHIGRPHHHTFPAALAAEEARLKRNAYIRDHYRQHTTAAGLRGATAAHLRDLAGKTS